MSTTLQALSERYLAALRTHLAEEAETDLAEGTETSLASADELGREALQMNLTAQDLALVHEEALATLVPTKHVAGDGDGAIRQAGLFFRLTLAPLAEAAVDDQANAPPAEPSETSTSVAELATVKKRLQREKEKRKTAESAIVQERRKYDKLVAESKIMQRQLRHLSHEILRAQEEERKKISRELHDEISQILTGINVRLAALKIESSANIEAFNKKIAGTQRLVEKSVATVHRFARDLRPAMLDDLGLIPALTTHLKDVRKRTGLQIHLAASKDATLDTVDTLKRTVLYRIAQEAVKNVEKHAQANRVELTVHVESDNICLEVVDDGTSFSVQSVLANKRRKRLGLVGMRERAEMVGGTFDIESVAGTGTTIRVRVPLRNGADKADKEGRQQGDDTCPQNTEIP